MLMVKGDNEERKTVPSTESDGLLQWIGALDVDSEEEEGEGRGGRRRRGN